MQKELIEKKLNIDPAQLNAYSVGLLQGRAYRVLNTHLNKALYEFDLSIPEWKLIGLLCEHGPMRLAEIAERLSVEAPLVTNLIDNLEKKSLVERKNDKSDRRAKIISPTKKGNSMIPVIDKKVKYVMAQLLSGAERVEMMNYMKVLQLIVNNS